MKLLCSCFRASQPSDSFQCRVLRAEGFQLLSSGFTGGLGFIGPGGVRRSYESFWQLPVAWEVSFELV